MSHDTINAPAGDTVERGHELDTIWTGTIASLAIGLLILVIVALFGIALAFQVLFPGPPLTDAGAEWRAQNRAPGVEPNQAYNRERLLAEEDNFLKQYAWENKDREIARIPIERAIELMADRKLQVEWPPIQASSNDGPDSFEEDSP